MNRESVKRLLAVLVASLALVGVMVTAGSSAASTKAPSASTPLKVALLLDAATRDGGWDQVAYNGMVDAEEMFGSKISVVVEQNVPFSSEAGAIVERLIGQGYSLFFADSSGYENFLAPIAKAYPTIRIEEDQGAVTSANYGMYEPDQYQAFYLAGEMLAGASKNGYIGMVAGFPFPAYYNIINGTEMGAKAVNPKATEHVIYVSSFFDPTKEASATQALIAAGATAIVGSTNDPSVCQTAAAAKIPCMNEDLLQSYGKSTYLGSAFMNSGFAFENVIGAVLAHKTVTRFLYGNGTTKANGVSFGPAYKSRESTSVQAKVVATIGQMQSGKFHDYAGPVSDNKGKPRVSSGKWLTQAQTVAQNWYVQGVKV